MPFGYTCNLLPDIAYPPVGLRPPPLAAYPKPTCATRALFIGWNPPRPYGGFWSTKFPDNLRNDLHRILKQCGQVKSLTPDQEFLEEFLNKGLYFIHTVKCWSEAKYPGFGAGAQTQEGRGRRKNIGLPLLSACVLTHLANELSTLSPQKVVALGEMPFLGLMELYPELERCSATPTEGQVIEKENFGVPWPLLYTCFPQNRPVLVRGSKDRKKATEVVHDHLRGFLEE